MLMYKRIDNFEVISYSDSNYIVFIDTQKSTSGYLFLLASGDISWISTKKTLTATSTIEDKFVSWFEHTLYGVWLKCLIYRLRVVNSISRSLKRYYDNLATIFMAKNNKNRGQNKHIDIKYLVIREHVK